MTQSPQISVYLVPALAQESDFENQTTVVIDVLRATTTITSALAAGADKVIPCLEVEQAKSVASKLGDQVLLGGERGGVKIAGFDLGNSPNDYPAGVVKGKTIVFTTTNGTKAMQMCRKASRMLLGAFTNLSAICDLLANEQRVAILCSGTGNEVTREDVLLAGAIVTELVQLQNNFKLNDQAYIAADAWRQAARDLRGATPLAEVLRQTQGGRNLIEIGQDNDIQIAATIDQLDVVAEVDLASWEIRLVSS